MIGTTNLNYNGGEIEVCYRYLQDTIDILSVVPLDGTEAPDMSAGTELDIKMMIEEEIENN